VNSHTNNLRLTKTTAPSDPHQLHDPLATANGDDGTTTNQKAPVHLHDAIVGEMKTTYQTALTTDPAEAHVGEARMTTGHHQGTETRIGATASIVTSLVGIIANIGITGTATAGPPILREKKASGRKKQRRCSKSTLFLP
jgi:hypothetical protein